MIKVEYIKVEVLRLALGTAVRGNDGSWRSMTIVIMTDNKHCGDNSHRTIFMAVSNQPMMVDDHGPFANWGYQPLIWSMDMACL